MFLILKYFKRCLVKVLILKEICSLQGFVLISKLCTNPVTYLEIIYIGNISFSNSCVFYESSFCCNNIILKNLEIGT